MSTVMVEFPIEEAEGILGRLAPHPHPSMSAAECDAAELGRKRLERAVRVERGPGGNSQPVSEMERDHREDYHDKDLIDGVVRSLDTILTIGRMTPSLRAEVELFRDHLKKQSEHIVAAWD